MGNREEILLQRFGRSRLDERRLDQLMGICEGVIADGSVCMSEAKFLQSWLLKNASLTDSWPANVIMARLDEMLGDGVLDNEEQGKLLELLVDVTGIHVGDQKTAAALPLCDPAPDVSFVGKGFVLTGTFVSGTRKECEQMIVALGGDVSRNVTKATDYLVIGELISDSWIHESYGRKIEKAVSYREESSRPAIVSEEHWSNFLKRND